MVSKLGEICLSAFFLIHLLDSLSTWDIIYYTFLTCMSIPYAILTHPPDYYPHSLFPYYTYTIHHEHIHVGTLFYPRFQHY